MMMGLRPILSDSVPKTMKNGVPISSDAPIISCAVVGSTLSCCGQEEQRIELARVPDHALAGGQAEQREQDDLAGCSSWPNDSVSGAFEVLPSSFMRLKAGDSLRLQPDPHRDDQQDERQPERHAPAPGVEGVGAEEILAADDDDQRQEQAERRRGLDPRRVGAALAVRRVLGDVGRGTAVLAAEGQALQQAQPDQDDRRRDPDRARRLAAGRRGTSTSP